EVHAPAFFEAVKRRQGQRGPGKKPAKVAVSLRIDPDTLAALKASGPGWQYRANEALRDLVKPSQTPALSGRLRGNRSTKKATAKKRA
ncbi:MAG: BrnA antitoxin family protein, partial [Methylobacteriaceae bacterium]|nr:BrnA antitoxin family protein [Methylobacteriaceae bacterium]